MMPENRINRNRIRTVCAIICMLSILCGYTQAQEPYAALNATGLENDISKQLIRKFQRDAARLALRIEAEKQDLRTMNISIPRGNIDLFFNMLTQIYMQDETARSIARCNVHTFANPSTDQITVVYDKNVEWANLLRQGLAQTSNSKINDLLERYDLIIEKHMQWNDIQDAITIRSVEPLNMAALANEFYKIQGVASIDLDLPSEPSNDIQVRRVTGGWEISYIMRFGEMKGDIKAHVWTYQAMDSGMIRLHSETGAPIPASMRCDLFNGPMIATRM